MGSSSIETTVSKILKSLPPHVKLVAAAKTRTPDEVQAALRGGIKILGYNYVQEAEKIAQVVEGQAEWHLIGHLQRNKVKLAVKLFDMIETLDSVRLATAINQQCALIGKIMPVLIEINSGREPQKTGILPENVEDFVRQVNEFPHLKVRGLMTMAPWLAQAEEIRPFFKATKAAFDLLKTAAIPNVEIDFLSMGMSHSYKIAIEEGANIVRIGTRLFGAR